MVARRTVTGGPLTARQRLEADDLDGVTEVMTYMKERVGSIQAAERGSHLLNVLGMGSPDTHKRV